MVTKGLKLNLEDCNLGFLIYQLLTDKAKFITVYREVFKVALESFYMQTAIVEYGEHGNVYTRAS